MTAKMAWHPGLLLLLLAVCLGGSGISNQAHAEAAQRLPPPMRAIQVDERPGSRLPLQTRFTDTRGKQVRLAEFFDGERPVVLIMAYTSCPMLCNLVLRGALEALPQLEMTLGQDFRALTVLIDPEETVETSSAKQQTLLAALGRDKPPETWPFLIGQKRNIDAVADAVGFGYTRDQRSGQFAHPAVLFVLTPQGEVSSYLHGVEYPPHDLRPALQAARAGRTQLSASIAESVMSCFRFDPALRKYGARIQTMFRVGATAVLLLLLGLVGLLLRWERRRT